MFPLVSDNHQGESVNKNTAWRSPVQFNAIQQLCHELYKF